MNITSSLKNYERGQITQAAHNYLSTIRAWGTKQGRQSTVDAARYELARLLGNQLDYRPDWGNDESDDEAVNIAKLIILMAEGFVPELWQTC